MVFRFIKGQLILKAIYGLLTSPKKRTNESVFLSWRLGNTWNLNFDFKFQVLPSRQDRKTSSLVHFLGEVKARQFCFEIYWPLVTNWKTLAITLCYELKVRTRTLIYVYSKTKRGWENLRLGAKTPTQVYYDPQPLVYPRAVGGSENLGVPSSIVVCIICTPWLR